MDTSKTMYQIGIKYIRPVIKEIKVISETDKTVMMETSSGVVRREYKKTSFDEIFPTWQEAYNKLLEFSREKVERAETRFEESVYDLRKVEAMKCSK